MTKLWSGPGCEDSPDYELVERDPVTGIGRFRKVTISERTDDEHPAVAAIRRMAPAQIERVFREFQRERQAPARKGGEMTHFNKRDAYASIDDAIETLAKAEFPDEEKHQAVTKFLATPDGATLYEMRDVVYNVRESGVEFAKIVAEAAIEVGAEKIRKNDPALSAEAAYCKALEASPELYDLYLTGD